MSSVLCDASLITEARAGIAYHFDSVTCQPVEYLEKQQADEQNDECCIERLAEDGECQQALRDRVPDTLVHALSGE